MGDIGEVRLYQLLTLDFDISGAVRGGLDSGWAFVAYGLLLKPQFKNALQPGCTGPAAGIKLGYRALDAGRCVMAGTHVGAWLAGGTGGLDSTAASIGPQPSIDDQFDHRCNQCSHGTQPRVVFGSRPTGYAVGCAGLVVFLVPSQVMALAMFLISRNLGWGSPGVAVWLSNTLMCLPFVLSLLRPEISHSLKIVDGLIGPVWVFSLAQNSLATASA